MDSTRNQRDYTGSIVTTTVGATTPTTDRGGRVASCASLFLSVCLMSCSGSVATPAQRHPSNQGAWQVILTVKTSGVYLGIAGIALDSHGNLYLAEFDDDQI